MLLYFRSVEEAQREEKALAIRHRPCCSAGASGKKKKNGTEKAGGLAPKAPRLGRVGARPGRREGLGGAAPQPRRRS